MKRFQAWIDAVDQAVQTLAGVSVHDLPDCPFAEWFEDEYTPQEAARQALVDAGFDEFDDEDPEEEG